MFYSARNAMILGIPPYWFWAGIGFSISTVFYMVLLYKNQYKVSDHIPLLGFGAIGLIVGAKLFGCITKVIILLQDNQPITIESLTTSGIVFYGGLLGFVLFVMTAYKVRQKKIPWEVMDLLSICIPLFHFFARLGCFFGGCCYGLELKCPISILYETNKLEATYRIPVQLFEAVIVFFIFLLLYYLHRSKRYKCRLMKLYFVLYSTARFLLEFLRGDLERGVLYGVSFSQIISVVILISILAISIFMRRYAKWKRLSVD